MILLIFLDYDEFSTLTNQSAKHKKNMKIAFTTLGCRTNQHDTAEMQTLMRREGFFIVGAQEKADVYVINTCSVTAKSDASSRLAVKKSLSINDQALVVFTGCYAQLNPEEASGLEGLDLVLGNANKLEIADQIKKRIAGNGFEKIEGLSDIHRTDIHADRAFETIPVTEFQGKTKAFIKVQTGCDQRCSFCTVVRARGKSVSESRENILRNVREAVAAGFKEITLTGINLGTYGMDKPVPETFSSLVRDVVDLKGDFRVRLSSINPMEIDADLLRLMAETEKLCPHLHIPLQSGDDGVLAKMRRNYSLGQYRDIVQRAAELIPNLGLGADVIVGFPGETDPAFENTRRLIEELPFTYLHVFSYSPRKGTEAYEFKENPPKKVKKERNKILTDLGRSKSLRFKENFLGRSVSVLFETQRDASTGRLKGHSEHYIPVAAEGADELKNKIVPVTVESVSENQVFGCLPS